MTPEEMNTAINKAINQHKKIRFRKIEYNVKKERVLHHGGEKWRRTSADRCAGC